MASIFYRYYFVCCLIHNCLALYLLSGNPSTILKGDNVTLELTCTVDDGGNLVIWRQTTHGQNITPMATLLFDNCTVQTEDNFAKNNGYNFRCNHEQKKFFLDIVVMKLRESISSYAWFCSPGFGNGSSLWSPTVFVPITNVNITPSKQNLSIMLGDTQQFTCTTNAGRPVALIEWYIMSKNVTNQATLVNSSASDGINLVSTSTLNYTVVDADHNKEVHCEAMNIEGRQKIKSEKIFLYIKFQITNVTITSFDGNTQNVSIIAGETRLFTCTTDAGRPAAWIEWYIGKQNVTYEATTEISLNGTKLVSKSKLNHTWIDDDHNKVVYCEANNIQGRPKLKSTELTLSIQVPVSLVKIKPIGVNNIAYIETNKVKTFNCDTDSSRPAALVHWIIGTRNETNKATLNISTIGTKFIARSTLNYTGNDTDHNTTIYCIAVNIDHMPVESRHETIYIQFPVRKAEILPVGHNNVIGVDLGKVTTFTCTTDSNRPAAKIQWYIGEQNLTTNASTVIDSDGTKFISISTMNYTGRDADHEQNVYCEAINIEGRQKAKSVNKTFYVIIPISSVDISPIFMNKSVTVISRKHFNFTCITSASRPGALIQWYIGEKNMTNSSISVIKSSDTKYISTSILNYTGKIADHSQNIHCEAVSSYDHVISQKESLHVLSSITNDEAYDLQREIFIGTNEGLDLTVYLIANPMPKITWTFVSNEEPSKNVIIKEFNNTSEDTFHHVTTYAKETVGQKDFGNYTMEADNDIGPLFVHVFSVKPAQMPQLSESSSAVIRGAVGSSAALIVVAVIGLVIFLRRRKKNKGNDKQHLQGLNGRNGDEDEHQEDGLKDNPLYGTSGVHVGGAVYSHVQKPTKEKNAPTVNTKDTNQKQKKVKQAERIALACVYENADDLRKSTSKNTDGNVNDDVSSAYIAPSTIRKTQKNKDGLIYADLEFAPTETGKKVVIRGLENKTSYAIIDLSKKAEPLPPDSDEDDTNHTGIGNTNN